MLPRRQRFTTQDPFLPSLARIAGVTGHALDSVSLERLKVYRRERFLVRRLKKNGRCDACGERLGPAALHHCCI